MSIDTGHNFNLWDKNKKFYNVLLFIIPPPFGYTNHIKTKMEVSYESNRQRQTSSHDAKGCMGRRHRQRAQGDI